MKAVLLDLDGVILHQPRVHVKVARKAAQYLHQRIPSVLHPSESAELSQFLYKQYGHTHTGMQAIYGDAAGTIKDFNDFVYTPDVLGALQHLSGDIFMQHHAQHAHRMIQHANRCGIPTYILTNAPTAWCREAVDILGLSADIPPHNMLCSDSVFTQTKPSQRLYADVLALLQAKHGDLDRVFLVDDVWMNLQPLMGHKLWHPVWFSAGGPYIRSKNVRTVCSLLDVIPML